MNEYFIVRQMWNALSFKSDLYNQLDHSDALSKKPNKTQEEKINNQKSEKKF